MGTSGSHILYMKNNNIIKNKKYNGFIDWVDRNTIQPSAIIAFLKLLSFCLSSIIGILVRNQNSEIASAVFIFTLPIAVDLAIESKLAYSNSSKSGLLSIVLGILFVVYIVIAFASLAGVLGWDYFKTLQNCAIFFILLLLYAFFYILEVFLLLIKALMNKPSGDSSSITVVR